MLTLLKYKLSSFLKKEEGQGLVEYALIIGLVSVVVIAVFGLLGDSIVAKFNEIILALAPAT